MIEPELVVFGCTSSSFFEGLAAEAKIRRSILAAGARQALTTSGAVVEALRALGARRVGAGTPYAASTAERLGTFLTEAGFEVVSLVSEVPDRLDRTSDAEVTALAEAAYRPGIDALFLSCTALETRHLLGPLSQRFGVPVVGAAQATMWAALGMVGQRMRGPDHPLHHLKPSSLSLGGVTRAAGGGVSSLTA
jgi:maleate isomerase